jgi:hypothetical protein
MPPYTAITDKIITKEDNMPPYTAITDKII